MPGKSLHDAAAAIAKLTERFDAMVRRNDMIRPGAEKGRSGLARGRIGEKQREERRKLPINAAVHQAILEAGYNRATGTEGPRVVSAREQERILRKNWEEWGPETHDYEKMAFPGVEAANRYFRNNGDMELTVYTSLKQIPRDYRPPKSGRQ